MNHYILRSRKDKKASSFTVSVEGELDRAQYPEKEFKIMRSWSGQNNIATLDHIQPTEYLKGILEGRKKDKPVVQEVGEFDDVEADGVKQ